MVNVTLGDVYKQGKQMMADKCEDYPSAFETGQLFLKVFGIDRQRLAMQRSQPADPGKVQEFYSLIHKRLTGYPLQYLMEEWDFYGMTFYVGEGVLIPRSDTEVLIETVLKETKGLINCKIADLCSGTGCIACTLAKEMPTSEVYAVELSDKAFPYLLKNIERHKLSNVLASHEDVSQFTPPQKLNFVVSNPPYLTDSDMTLLQEEVVYEPTMALHAGDDGLYFYRLIAQRYFEWLHHKGTILFEVGAGQHLDVGEILTQAGYAEIRYYEDLNQITRVVTAVKP